MTASGRELPVEPLVTPVAIINDNLICYANKQR